MDSTIDEFFVVNDEEVNDEEVGRFGIYTTNDKNTLFLYSYDGSERCLECIRKDQLDAAKALLEEIIRINEKAGFRIQRSH